MAQKIHVPNQLKRELMGVIGLNPFPGFDSSSRQQMFASHVGQALVIAGSTPRRLQTGMEREYAKYTFSVKMPVDAEIIKTIDRYRQNIGTDAIALNPERAVIYEDVHTKEIGILLVRNYCSYHQYFGFEYQSRSAMADLRPGAFISKDTILKDSPSVTEHGDYQYGIELAMAFMSHPAVSEDGIMICRDVLHKLAIKTYETRVVEWGSKRFPLNIYGDPNKPGEYKPFPDIGEFVRDDGLLMALRSYETDLAVVEQGINDLREPDYIFDRRTYAVAGHRGRVVDIRLHHDAQGSTPGASSGMDAQPEKYDRARRQYYKEIMDEYNRLRRERGDALRLTPAFNRVLVEAQAVLLEESQRIVMLHRQAPLDTWRVEFVIEYNLTPTDGFKLTDCHGGKGVICYIAEPHEMPVDEAGNRADVVMDPNSTVSRMNLGRLYEQYINAASRDVSKNVRRLIAPELETHSAPPTNNVDAAREKIEHRAREKTLEKTLMAMDQNGDDKFEKAWNYLLGYYKIVSPKMFVWMTSGEYKQSRAHHLYHVVKEGVYLYYPPDNDPEAKTIIAELEKYYKPTYGPVTYTGYSGKKVTTKVPVRIGSLYMILLEKIGDDWTAVSSGKTQHFGVLSQVTNHDKFSTPVRNQAIRAWGEAEFRIGNTYTEEDFVPEVLDRNNNAHTHKEMLHNILGADKPTNVENLVDRKKIPLGGARSLILVKHIAECGGWEFSYTPYVPPWLQPGFQPVQSNKAGKAEFHPPK